jgi:hypothetical protein
VAQRCIERGEAAAAGAAPIGGRGLPVVTSETGEPPESDSLAVASGGEPVAAGEIMRGGVVGGEPAEALADALHVLVLCTLSTSESQS